jgi:hypothetical protein
VAFVEEKLFLVLFFSVHLVLLQVHLEKRKSSINERNADNCKLLTNRVRDIFGLTIHGSDLVLLALRDGLTGGGRLAYDSICLENRKKIES